MKKNLSLLAVLIISTIAVLYFIKISNDHAECSEQMLNTKHANVQTSIQKTHICNEKYNF